MIRWALADTCRPLTSMPRRFRPSISSSSTRGSIVTPLPIAQVEAGVEDARGDQVELELLAVAHDRVAGVVAALEADHEVGPLGEQVGDLPLPLVAPLGADYDYSRHHRDSLEAP